MEIKVRMAKEADVAKIAALEKAAFPPEEAIPEDRLLWFFRSFPEGFAVSEISAEDGSRCEACEVAAAVVCRPTLLQFVTDEIYEKKEMPRGDTFAIMTFIVAPHLQRQRLGDRTLDAALALFREKGAKGFSLACKEHLTGFYAKHGFMPAGHSELTLGGAVWQDMYLPK